MEKAKTRTTDSRSASGRRPARRSDGPKGDLDVKAKLTVGVSAELLERARDACYWLSGPPTQLNLSKLVEQALERELKRLAKKEGKPFKPRPGELSTGRPRR